MRRLDEQARQAGDPGWFTREPVRSRRGGAKGAGRIHSGAGASLAEMRGVQDQIQSVPPMKYEAAAMSTRSVASMHSSTSQ